MSPAAAPPAGGTVALALGGGAALGWAHIGVLRVLAENGIRVGAVAGTSIGALAALCLAADRLEVLEEIARGTTRWRMVRYLDPHLRRGAWLGGRRIARELAGHFGGLTFQELPIPAAAIAADLDTAKEVRLTTGPVVDAVTASMALPGLFAPVVRDGRTLVDGGMAMNIPVAAARSLAPALPVVAVDLMGDYAGHVRAAALAGRRSAVATLRSAFLILMNTAERQALTLDPPDVLVRVPVGHLSSGAFHLAEELIALGRTATEQALPAIAACTKNGQCLAIA